MKSTAWLQATYQGPYIGDGSLPRGVGNSQLPVAPRSSQLLKASDLPPHSFKERFNTQRL